MHLSGPLAEFFSAKGTSPEVAEAPKVEVARCEDACTGLSTAAFLACIAQCKATGKTPQETPFGIFAGGSLEQIRNLIVIVLGIFLILIALALITR